MSTTPPLSATQALSLQPRLEELLGSTDIDARLASDPVAFPHRYSAHSDQEIAGFIAASLAYGRVSQFGAVLERLFALMDQGGGPTAYLQSFTSQQHRASLLPIQYRWNRGMDFVLLFATLRHALEVHGSLEALFTAYRPSQPTVRDALTSAMSRLRASAVEVAPSCGIEATCFADLPRGFRYFLCSPSSGSGCKRLCMWLRWMVREADGVDLGLWTSIPSSALVIPVDTHVLRIARFIGLTKRTDGSWRTAEEITRSLAVLDPADPVRFDFALAHLGISGTCKGVRHPDVCPSCPLDALCMAPAA